MLKIAAYNAKGMININSIKKNKINYNLSTKTLQQARTYASFITLAHL